MYARTITIDGTEFTVPCDPATPYSEVLRRAAKMAKREEKESRPDRLEPFPANYSV